MGNTYDIHIACENSRSSLDRKPFDPATFYHLVLNDTTWFRVKLPVKRWRGGAGKSKIVFLHIQKRSKIYYYNDVMQLHLCYFDMTLDGEFMRIRFIGRSCRER